MTPLFPVVSPSAALMTSIVLVPRCSATCRSHAVSHRLSCLCRDFYNAKDALAYARKALQAGQSAQHVADGLVDRALKRYTADNVAIIVLKFPWSLQQGSRSGMGGAKSNGANARKMFGFLK
jgi:hypothetical protein